MHHPYHQSQQQQQQQQPKAWASLCASALSNLQQQQLRRHWGPHLEDFEAVVGGGAAHVDDDVKAPLAQKRVVQQRHTVCGAHHQNAVVDLKAVHLIQQLQQPLLAFLGARVVPAPARLADRVDLVCMRADCFICLFIEKCALTLKQHKQKVRCPTPLLHFFGCLAQCMFGVKMQTSADLQEVPMSAVFQPYGGHGSLHVRNDLLSLFVCTQQVSRGLPKGSSKCTLSCTSTLCCFPQLAFGSGE